MAIARTTFALAIAVMTPAALPAHVPPTAHVPQQGAALPKTTMPARPGAVSPEDSEALALGWGFLGQGEYAKASQKALEVLARSPRSGPAGALSIEIDIARTGSGAGLDAYERWLGSRPIEEPALLGRVAQAYLQEMSTQTFDSSTRFEAMRTLAASGDAEAQRSLMAASAQGGVAETRYLASTGDANAVRKLLAEFEQPRPPSTFTMIALGQSKSPLALAPLTAKLKEPRPEVRGAAAEALGFLGGPSAIAALTQALTDQSGHVRMKAAAALFRLNDLSGLSIIQAAANSDLPSGQLAAAEAMASRPDAAWHAVVRKLAQSPDPDTRLDAARLLADQDPAASAAVLQGLSTDANPAIREEAVRRLADESVDLTTLRRLLRHSDAQVKARAAQSVLRLTK